MKEQIKSHEAKMQKTLDVLSKEAGSSPRRPRKPGGSR